MTSPAPPPPRGRASRTARLLAAVVLAGAAAGLVGIAMAYLLEGFEWLFYGVREGALPERVAAAPAWRRVLAPALGGVLAGALWWWERATGGVVGVEAAVADGSGAAAARMGLSTALFTINLDAVGNMPCNPSIGGTGKGHLVYEIDALGGEMGKTADKVTLQSRVLNLGKGTAVHSKRIQADRQRYRMIMKHTIE